MGRYLTDFCFMDLNVLIVIPLVLIALSSTDFEIDYVTFFTLCVIVMFIRRNMYLSELLYSSLKFVTLTFLFSICIDKFKLIAIVYLDLNSTIYIPVLFIRYVSRLKYIFIFCTLFLNSIHVLSLSIKGLPIFSPEYLVVYIITCGTCC